MIFMLHAAADIDTSFRLRYDASITRCRRHIAYYNIALPYDTPTLFALCFFQLRYFSCAMMLNADTLLFHI